MADGFGVQAFGFGASFSPGGVSTNKYKLQLRKHYEAQKRYGIPLLDQQYGVQQKYVDKAWANDREFRQTAVPDMVQGAQAAGIHPLLAMGGGGGGGGQPSQVGSPGALPYQPDPPRGVRSYSLKTASPAEKAAVTESKARTDLLNTQSAEISQRMLRENMEASARQAGTSSQDGVVDIQPDVKTSANPKDKSETAGRDHPTWKSLKLGSGKNETIIAPVQDADTLWDSVAAWGPIMSIKENRQAIQNILDRKSKSAWNERPIWFMGKFIEKPVMNFLLKFKRGNSVTKPVRQPNHSIRW